MVFIEKLFILDMTGFHKTQEISGGGLSCYMEHNFALRGGDLD